MARLPKLNRTKRRLSIEQIEQRRLLAMVALDVNLFDDTGAGPGVAIPSNQIEVGETFYVAIDVKEYHPLKRGLTGVSLDIRWDPAVLQSLDAERDLPEIVTGNLPTFLRGELHEETGEFENLGGSALRSQDLGRAIGDGIFETFAMLRFEAIAEASGMTFEIYQGKSRIVMTPTAVPRDADIDVFSEPIQIVAASPPSPEPNPSEFSAETVLATVENTNSEASFLSENDTLGMDNSVIESDPSVPVTIDVFADPPSHPDVMPDDPKSPTIGTGVAEAEAEPIADLSDIAGDFIGLDPFEIDPMEPIQSTDETQAIVSPGDEGTDLTGQSVDNHAPSPIVPEPSLPVPTVPLPPLIQVSSPGSTGSLLFGTTHSEGMHSAFVRPGSSDALQSIEISNVGESPLQVHEIYVGIVGLSLAESDADAATGFTLLPQTSRTIALDYSTVFSTTSFHSTVDPDQNDGIIVVSDAANRSNFGVSNIGLPTFAADIDLDGRVGASDFALLDMFFGSQRGDEGYLEGLDPNTDGSVDLGDFGLMNAQFGMVHPTLSDSADNDHDSDNELDLAIDLIANDLHSLDT